MTEYPRITELLDNCARWPDWRKNNKDLETELRALLAERDALKAKAQPVRKLREYKGVTYADGNWRNSAGSWASVSQLIAWVANSSSQRLTDADHAAIYALKDDPYEPVETVEGIVSRAVAAFSMNYKPLEESYFKTVDRFAADLRAAVAAEGVRDA